MSDQLASSISWKALQSKLITDNRRRKFTTNAQSSIGSNAKGRMKNTLRSSMSQTKRPTTTNAPVMGLSGNLASSRNVLPSYSDIPPSVKRKGSTKNVY